DGCRRLGAWQQHLRLDVNQRRRHQQEVARDVEVELLHQVDGGKVLRGDQRDRNVVDVQLVFPDEVKQEIERPLEDRELDRKRVGGGFEFVMIQYLPTHHG